MRLVNKKDSIYFQLLRLLLIAFSVAMIWFVFASTISDLLIDKYCYEIGYRDKKDLEYVKKLQAYVSKYEISTRDSGRLKDWVKKQKVISIRVYKDGIEVFDSEYPDQDLWEEDIELNEYAWETYYTVEFADGNARIGVTGRYSYRFYFYAMAIELLLSSGLFLGIFLAGIRKKMRYVSILYDEIKILEGGSLEYEITEEGSDELTALAEGLNSMRRSFQHLLDRETEILKENGRIITEMSHDLRTPVTAIMLYIEVMKKEKYQNREQMMEYLEKINQKACRMKQLTDHLFEYSLVSGETVSDAETTECFRTVFYDLISETCNYLAQSGYEIDLNIQWTDSKIIICSEYIVRILDNITSNILKYADVQEKVTVLSLTQDDLVGLVFENKKKAACEMEEGFGVGLQSIKNMMKKMKGSYQIIEYNNKFRIEILFRMVDLYKGE